MNGDVRWTNMLSFQAIMTPLAPRKSHKTLLVGISLIWTVGTIVSLPAAMFTVLYKIKRLSSTNNQLILKFFSIIQSIWREGDLFMYPHLPWWSSRRITTRLLVSLSREILFHHLLLFSQSLKSLKWSMNFLPSIPAFLKVWLYLTLSFDACQLFGSYLDMLPINIIFLQNKRFIYLSDFPAGVMSK